MKKVIKLVISIFILILFFELIAFIFKTHHEITYNIKEKNLYMIFLGTYLYFSVILKFNGSH